MAVVASLDVVLRAKTDKLTKGLSKATKSIASFGAAGAATVATAGLAAAGVAAGGLAFGIVKAVGKAREFNSEFAKSTAIMGDLTDEQKLMLKNAALDVGSNTMFTAAQAAAGLFDMASAGLSAEESALALGKAATFATAGSFELGKAGELLLGTWSALGLKADDTAQSMANLEMVGDTLVMANTLGQATVEQFAEALNRSGGALKLTGKSIQEGTAAIAMFAGAGIKGSEAGNLLRAMLVDLQTKGDKNAKAFKKLGINVFDASGKMRSMPEIVADFEKSLGGMTDAQKAAAFAQLQLSETARNGISVLMGQSQALQSFQDRLGGAGGTMAEVADKNLPVLEKMLIKVKGVWDKFLIIGGQKVISMIEKLGEDFLADKLAQGLDKVSSAVAALGAFVAAHKDDFIAMAKAFAETFSVSEIIEGFKNDFVGTFVAIKEAFVGAFADFDLIETFVRGIVIVINSVAKLVGFVEQLRIAWGFVQGKIQEIGAMIIDTILVKGSMALQMFLDEMTKFVPGLDIKLNIDRQLFATMADELRKGSERTMANVAGMQAELDQVQRGRDLIGDQFLQKFESLRADQVQKAEDEKAHKLMAEQTKVLEKMLAAQSGIVISPASL